jgi:hypothetical protein
VGRRDDTHNRLIFKHYFSISVFFVWVLQFGPANSYMLGDETWQRRALFDFAERKNGVRRRQSICVFCGYPNDRSAQLQATANPSFEPNTLRRH